MAEEVPWVVRFVDEPEVDRSVRLDLNDEPFGGDCFVDRDGFTLGDTERLVALVDSMLREGQDVAASKHNNRELVIPVVIKSDDLATFAAKLNTIARECDREVNYLEFRPGEHTGEPVFFVVKQGDVGSVDIDPEEQADERTVALHLVCEPVAVGLPQTGTFPSVGNNPATAGHMIATMPTIIGDLPAPLNVEATWTANQGIGFASTVLLNRHVSSTGAHLSRVEQVESWTLQPDASLPGSDSAMSGTGSSYVRVSFATATQLQSRAVKTITGVPVGTYKVFARCRKSVAADEIDVRLQAGVGSLINGPTKRIPGTAQPMNGPVWVDMGTLTVPEGGTVPPGVTTADVKLQLQAGRVSGTGNLDFDVIRLVPAMDFPGLPDPETTLLTHLGDGTTSTVVLGWDTENEQPYVTVGGTVGALKLRPGPMRLRVLPGYTNYLVFMRHVGYGYDPANSAPSVDKLTDTTALAWNYRPRWLYLSKP